jgi:hypothetical protein
VRPGRGEKRGEKELGAKAKLTIGSKNDRAIKKSARATTHVPNVEVPALRNTIRSPKTIAAPKVRMKAPPTGKAPAANKGVNKKAADKLRAKPRGVRNELAASELAQAMMGEMAAHGEDSVLERQAARSQREREVLGRLAVSMARTDEMPNQELAADIVVADDIEAVDLLIRVIERHDDAHAGDAARVLCEVGTRAPELVVAHADRLLAMCDDTRKDMLPFTMFALSPLAPRYAEALWDLRDLFWAALADLTQPADMAQAGAVRLLSSLCSAGPDYARTLAGGLVDLLGKCMPKDVAFFAESVLPALGTAHSHRAKPVLDRRMKELTPAEVARLRRAVRAAQTGVPLSAAA